MQAAIPKSLALVATATLLAGSASTAPVPSPIGRTVLGPAAVCHPVRIGDAKSLPWNGTGGFTTLATYDVAGLVPDTLSILAESKATLVHMETLRRAVIYVSGLGGERDKRSKDSRREQASELCAELERAVERRLEAARQGTAITDAQLGLAWFDLGYAQRALQQVGIELGDCGKQALEKALDFRPDDGAAHLGYALANWHVASKRARYEHIEQAIDAAGKREGLLAQSLLSTTGTVMGCASFDDLAAEIRRGLGRG